MSGTRMAILTIGLLAGLIQLAVPPHSVRVSDILDEKHATVTRWYRLGGEPEAVVMLRGKEAWDGDLDAAMARAHSIDTTLLAIQLAATAILVALGMLFVGPRKVTPSQEEAAPASPGAP